MEPKCYDTVRQVAVMMLTDDFSEIENAAKLLAEQECTYDLQTEGWWILKRFQQHHEINKRGMQYAYSYEQMCRRVSDSLGFYEKIWGALSYRDRFDIALKVQVGRFAAFKTALKPSFFIFRDFRRFP